MLAASTRRHVGPRRAEARQLYARDRRLGATGGLVYLEPGGAPALRADCRAGHLVCPYPGCPAPRLVARGGTRRDHFAHQRLEGAAGHAPERWFHLCAKHLVGAWARRQCPAARVVVDEEAVDNGQVPDVLVLLPDGPRVAFEVQYAALTVEHWQRRHAGYAAQGILDVWLFGHIPPHLRAARGPAGQDWRVFTPLLEAVELAGGLVHWIDPDRQAILTPVHRIGDQRVRSTSGAYLLVEAAADPLAACRLTLDGMRSAADEAQAAERPAHLALLAREARARAIRQAQQADHDRVVAEHRARQRAASQAAWEAYRRAKFADPARIPPILLEEGAEDADMAGYLPVHWHARLFEEVIQGRVGRTFTYSRAAAPFLAGRRDHPRPVYRALTAYLHRLRAAGYVAFDSNASGWIEGEIRVLADTHHPPAGPPTFPTP